MYHFYLMEMNKPALLSPNNQASSNLSNSANKGYNGSNVGQSSQLGSQQNGYPDANSNYPNEVGPLKLGMNSTAGGHGFGGAPAEKQYQIGGTNGNSYG